MPSRPDAPPPPADPLLYGHDPTERIVALHPVSSNGDGGPGERVRVYRRTADDRVEHEDRTVHPFFFLSDLALLRGFPRGRYRRQSLTGEGFFRHLLAFPDRSAYWDALRHVERAAGTDKNRPDAVYLPGQTEQQYLTQTGRTLFKGMELTDVHRLQFDIEVHSRDGFPQAEVEEHRVIIVALRDNRGWHATVHARDLWDHDPAAAEAHVLRETVRLVRERDPDVVEGHNVFSFDLPYVMARCRRHGVPFALGRDGSEPRTFASSMRFAERQVEFDACEIAGRHVVDTLFQVMSFDVFKRDLPAYTLKAAAKYFGIAPPGRTYVEGADIARTWDDEPARLLDYAQDDVVETEGLARRLSGSSFYLAQMVPIPYGQAARTGPAAKIESLFVRAYLHARRALPRSQYGSQAVGGYTDVFVTGVVGPVVYADVESLYPSIMLNYDVQPAGDTLGVFPKLLRTLTDLRFETKAAMKATDDEHARSELDARQTAYKNVINSFYGNMGFSYALFNDFDEADRVARTGQDILRQMLGAIEARGGRVVEVDTDGVLFVPPPHVRGDAAERAFVAALSDALPDGIRVGFDGRFEKMLSYKKKNYALRAYGGALKFKGSSLVSRSVERFGRRFVREAIELLLDEDIAGLHALYLGYRRTIERHEWINVEEFQRVETLKSTLAEYEAAVAEGKRTRTAAYELASRKERETGRAVRRGERVAYYLAAGAGTRAFEQARFASEWDPATPDEDAGYYLDRLDQFAAKFEPFFERPSDFRLVFGPEDLFGFSPEGIGLAVHERSPAEVEDDVPF